MVRLPSLRPKPWRPALCALILALPAPPALAHEYWLAPSRYRPVAGERVEISALVGTGFRGERRRYSSARTVAFTLQGAQRLDLRAGAASGDLVWAAFVAPDGGGAMAAYESSFATIELPADEFDAYLKLEGLHGPLAARAKRGAGAGPGRERYRRCAKSWIAGGRAERATPPIGLPLEIVPETPPGAAPRLAMKVLFNGRPLAGALVRAWRTPLAGDAMPADAASRDSVGVFAQGHTDARGRVSLAVEQTGEWLVSVVHMLPCRERDVADWESTWASLTFCRPAPGQ